MEVRLTDSGKKLFDKTENVINVSTKRAFVLMENGYALKDKVFFRLHAGNNPKEVKEIKEIKEVKPKQETAVSYKAVKREKAVIPKKFKKR